MASSDTSTKTTPRTLSAVSVGASVDDDVEGSGTISIGTFVGDGVGELVSTSKESDGIVAGTSITTGSAW